MITRNTSLELNTARKNYSGEETIIELWEDNIMRKVKE